MKILLHGATNFRASNFGDFLYGDYVARFIENNFPSAEVRFFQPSSFFKRYLRAAAGSRFRIWETEALVYIPGGYFGEGHAYRFRDVLIHFLRFLPVGLLVAALKKPIAIVGIGAGPIRSPALRWPIRFIASRASVVVARDVTSVQALMEIGVPQVTLGSDPILASDVLDRTLPTDQTAALFEPHDARRTVFIHYNHSIEAMRSFAGLVRGGAFPADRYRIIVGSDQELTNDAALLQEFRSLALADVEHFIYGDPYELVDLLQRVDLVLTCKLHVGVVAAMFGRSVVCAAEHPEKSRRFYLQMGCPDRCVSVFGTSVPALRAVIDRYQAHPMSIPDAEVRLANLNWMKLSDFLSRLQEDCA